MSAGVESWRKKREWRTECIKVIWLWLCAKPRLVEIATGEWGRGDSDKYDMVVRGGWRATVLASSSSLAYHTSTWVDAVKDKITTQQQHGPGISLHIYTSPATWPPHARNMKTQCMTSYDCNVLKAVVLLCYATCCISWFDTKADGRSGSLRIASDTCCHDSV